jgi:hypothetical protein
MRSEAAPVVLRGMASLESTMCIETPGLCRLAKNMWALQMQMRGPASALLADVRVSQGRPLKVATVGCFDHTTTVIQAEFLLSLRDLSLDSAASKDVQRKQHV